MKELRSQRLKRLSGDVPTVFTYGPFSETLRNQIEFIIRYIFRLPKNGPFVEGNYNFNTFKIIYTIYLKELGKFALAGMRAPDQDLFVYFHDRNDTDRQLDIIELFISTAQQLIDDNPKKIDRGIHAEAIAHGIQELNQRFKQHGIGYKYVDGQIIRVDSEIIHESAVEPALKLMHANGYEGALDEFTTAFDHFKHGRYEEAITDANSSFESTMKTICERKEWEVSPTATSSQLIACLLDNELIERHWQDQLGALRSVLIGVSTARNRSSGHGQGASPREVPEHLAGYVLHMTASNIVFLISAAL